MTTKTQRPIVILDMDDVTAVDRQYTSYQVKMAFQLKDLDYPELWSGLILPEARENLKSLHDEFWPQYVSSTSWTNFLSQEEMKEVFRRTGMAFIADNMHKHWTTPKGETSGRLTEVSNWLRMHRRRRQPTLILDDLESGWSFQGSTLEHEGLVVLCKPWVGFVAEKYLEAQKVLQRQLATQGSACSV